MSEEYTSANIRFVTSNQFTTIHDQLKSSIEEHDQHINAIDHKIDSMDNAIKFNMNTVGDVKSKSEK